MDPLKGFANWQLVQKAEFIKGLIFGNTPS